MEKEYDKEQDRERVKTLKEITARNTFREIEGCTSWRHDAVHQDRAWLLRAISKIQDQVKGIQKAEIEAGSNYVIDAEVLELFRMFEEESLNHIGDEEE